MDRLIRTSPSTLIGLTVQQEMRSASASTRPACVLVRLELQQLGANSEEFGDALDGLQ